MTVQADLQGRVPLPGEPLKTNFLKEDPTQGKTFFVDDDELMLNVLRCHLTY